MVFRPAQVFRLGMLVTFIIAVFSEGVRSPSDRLLLDLNTEVIDFIHDRSKSLSPLIPCARLEPDLIYLRAFNLRYSAGNPCGWAKRGLSFDVL